MQVEEIFFWEKSERKTGEFRYPMTITKSLLVAYPIKMQDLHQSTSWVMLMADSIRVAQPIRLQHLHQYTSRILLKLDGDTELTRAVDVCVLQAHANRIYIFTTVKKLFSFFFVTLFSKGNRRHVLRVSIELQKLTLEKVLESSDKAVEKLACGSFSHSISRSPKLPLVFL